MTPKEKALSLKNYMKNGYGKFNDIQSELISLIVCEQVINELSDLPRIPYNERREKYWKDVKKEVEKP